MIQTSAFGMNGGRLRPRIHESIPRLGGEGFMASGRDGKKKGEGEKTRKSKLLYLKLVDFSKVYKLTK